MPKTSLKKIPKSAVKKSVKPAKKAPKPAPEKFSSEPHRMTETEAKIAVKARKPAAPAVKQYFYAAGKRKTAVARIKLFLKPKNENRGTAESVNGKPLDSYFPISLQQQIVHSPFKIAGQTGVFDFSADVEGGGPWSQAEAIRHAVSRALLTYDPGLRASLKPAGFLTRDARMKERKKYGLHRARRGPQFSKR